MGLKDLFFKPSENEGTQNSQQGAIPSGVYVKERPMNYVNNNNNVQGAAPIIPNPTLPPPSYVPNTPPSAVTTITLPTVDDAIVNKIWDKIIAANRPGPDYLELKNNVEALEDLPISNEQKLMSAFKVLKKGYPNFQKDDITRAIDFYIKVVEDEKTAGLKELDNMVASNITGVRAEIDSLQTKADELRRQHEEIMSLIQTKTESLNHAQEDIDAKHNAFIGSVDAVLNILNNDKNNVMTINF